MSGLVEQVRRYEKDHGPEGYPCVKMKMLSEMADLIEKQDRLMGLQKQMIALIYENAIFTKGTDHEKYLALVKQIEEAE